MDKIAGRVVIVCVALILAAWVFVRLIPATAPCGAFTLSRPAPVSAPSPVPQSSNPTLVEWFKRVNAMELSNYLAAVTEAAKRNDCVDRREVALLELAMILLGFVAAEVVNERRSNVVRLKRPTL